jgi:DNA-binding transcriptional regulator GbsR (MarR family)
VKVGKRTGSLGFEDECADLFAEVVQIFGIPKSIGYIYGILFSSSEPLSFSDIVQRGRISKGSASQGLQLLRELGAIKQVHRPNGGLPYVLFEPELGLRRLISGILKGKIAPLITNGDSRARRLRQVAASASTRATRDFQIARVKQLDTWRQQMGLILPVLKTLLLVQRD